MPSSLRSRCLLHPFSPKHPLSLTWRSPEKQQAENQEYSFMECHGRRTEADQHEGVRGMSPWACPGGRVRQKLGWEWRAYRCPCGVLGGLANVSVEACVRLTADCLLFIMGQNFHYSCSEIPLHFLCPPLSDITLPFLSPLASSPFSCFPWLQL